MTSLGGVAPHTAQSGSLSTTDAAALLWPYPAWLASSMEAAQSRPRTPLTTSAHRRDLSNLASNVERWAGNPCEILDRSEQGLATMAANSERLLTGIRRDGRAVVGSLQTVPFPFEVA